MEAEAARWKPRTGRWRHALESRRVLAPALIAPAVLFMLVVIFIAGRASIPNEVEDASRIDGATGVKKLWYVDLPLQLPIALVAVLFGIVFTAADFAVVWVLTRGGPFNSTQVLTTWSEVMGIESSRVGAGAAISLYLFPLLLAVTILMLFFARRAQVS